MTTIDKAEILKYNKNKYWYFYIMVLSGTTNKMRWKEKMFFFKSNGTTNEAYLKDALLLQVILENIFVNFYDSIIYLILII